jgi:hypothetical protein
MPNAQLVQGGGQYQNQNAYRTINLAFAPYFPETQRYKMQLDGQFSGNRGGYFSVRPESDAAGGKHNGYPWKLRTDSYDAKAPIGRLSTLNTYSRKDMAVKSSQSLNLPMEGSQLGRELSNILSAENGRIGRQHDINNANELELAMIGREIENFLNVGVSQPITPASQHREGALSTQSLDLHFEENIGLAETLENLTNRDDVGRSLGIEVTTASNKRLGNVREALGDINNARTVFANHANREVATLNREIQSKLIGPARKQDRRGTIPLGASATDDQRLLETARSRFNMGAAGTMDSFGRRLLSRQSEVLQYNIAHAITKDSIMEQVPLGDDMQGIAVIRGFVIDIGGIPTPQFDVVNTYVVYGASLAEAVTIQATHDVGTTNVDAFNIAISHISNTARDDAYRLSAREASLGEIHDASYAIDAIYGLSLYVGKAPSNKGIMGLTTPGIADGIRLQIEELMRDPSAQNEFASFYEKMILRSNRLTEQWKSSVPSGRKHGASIAGEWTYGDLQGNPHKKYLGIWGARGEDVWEDSGTYGHNVSISPFLTSRREGSVKFK